MIRFRPLFGMKDDKIFFPPALPKNGLRCYWDTATNKNTDVNKARLYDLSGNDNHGTVRASAFNSSDSGYQADGLHLDGVDDIIFMTLHVGLNTATMIFHVSHLTMSMGYQNIMSSNQFIFFSNSNSNFELTLTNGVGTYVVPTSLGAPKFLIYTKTPTTFTIRIVGENRTEVTQSYSATTSFTNFTIGQWSSTYGNFRFKRLGVWDRVLSANEIKNTLAHFNNMDTLVYDKNSIAFSHNSSDIISTMDGYANLSINNALVDDIEYQIIEPVEWKTMDEYITMSLAKQFRPDTVYKIY